VRNETGTLTRAEFLTLAGVSTHQLKALVRRDQIPYIDEEEASPQTAATKDRHGWRRYFVRDALAMILMAQFAEDGGISNDEAKRAVVNSLYRAEAVRNNGIRSDILTRDGIANQIWIGVAQLGDDGRAHVGGTMIDIQVQIQQSEKRFDSGCKITRLTLSNVSQAFKTLVERAQKAGIDISKELIDADA